MWVEGAFEFVIVAVVGITLASMNLPEADVRGDGRHVRGPAGHVDGRYRRLAPLLVGRSPRHLGAHRQRSLHAGTLPLVTYYEHGTYMTVGHAHATMFGAFGCPAIAMALYMLRTSTRDWSGRRLRWSFWLWNAGLALVVFVSVLPVGFLQLETAFPTSYDAARSIAFSNREAVRLLFWARISGDTVLIAGTPLFTYDVVDALGLRRDVTDPEDVRVPARTRANGSDD